MALKSKVVKLLQKVVGQKWVLGITRVPVSEILKGEDPKYEWIKSPYSDRWFADPFLLEETQDSYLILCEEFRYSTEIGRIALLTVEKNTLVITAMKILLELDSHLSFPHIIRENGKVYIVPENGAGGELSLYIYKAANQVLEKKRVLLKERLADAIILNLGNSGCFLFATKVPHEHGPELCIYKDFGNAHSIESSDFRQIAIVECGIEHTRMAGVFFSLDSVLYRPAQDCKDCYGHAVRLQKVIQTDETHWNFVDIISLNTGCPNIEQGFHTFNVNDNVILVDKRVFRHPRIAMLFEWIKPVAVKLLD